MIRINFRIASSKILPIIIFILAVCVLIFGYFFNVNQRAKLKIQIDKELKSIAVSKVAEIHVWLHEREGDALFFAENPRSITELENVIYKKVKQEAALRRIKNGIAQYNYSDIMIVDTLGNVALNADNEFKTLSDDARNLINKINKGNDKAFFDLYMSKRSGKIRFDFATTLYTIENGKRKLMGYIILRMDPNIYLYPLIEKWTTNYKTAETVIVRQENDSVLYLNNLGKIGRKGLSFKVPLSNPNIASVKAIHGNTGLFEGENYKGIKVIAHAEKITDTDWYIISQVDAAEVYDPIHSLAIITGIILTLILIILGTILFVIRNAYQKSYFKKLYDSELERKALTSHFEYLIKNANDIIILANKDGRIIEANESALKAYKMRREEIINSNLNRLGTFRVKKGKGAEAKAYETTHQRADGSSFPVEINEQLITIEGELFYQAVIRDITERKLNEKNLYEKERIYRDLVETINDVIFKVSNKGLILYVSPVIEKITGYTPDELLGNNFLNYVYEPDKPLLIKKLSNLKDEEFHSLEYRFIKKTGAMCWVRTSTTPIIEDGVVIGETGTITDITAQKLAEAELYKTNELYTSIVKVSPDMITISDFNGILKFASPKVCQVFGYSDCEEFIGKPISIFFPPNEGQRAIEEISRMLNGEKLGAVEYKGIKRDGTLFDLEINSSTIFDPNGEPTGFVSVSRDITERKITEKQLLESQRKFQQMVETINDAIYEVGMDGIVHYVSPAIEKIVGYKPEEIIGTNFFGYMYPEDRPILLDALRNLGKTDFSFLEYRYLCKDGSIRWVRSSTNPLYDSNGQIKAGRGSLTDINELKTTAEELNKSEELHRKLFDHNPIPMWIYELDTLKFLHVNETAIKKYGFSRDEFLGMTLMDIRPKEDIENLKKNVNDSKGEIIHESRDWRHILKDGKVINVDIHSYPIDYEEKTARMVAVYDITERVKAQHELQKSEEKYRSLINSSDAAITMMDFEGHYLFLNEIAAKPFGTTPEKMIGINAQDLFPSDQVKQIMTDLNEIKERNEGFVKEVYVDLVGKSTWFRTSIQPVRDELGNPTSVLLHSTNITESKLAEEKVKQSEKKYKALFIDSPDAFLIAKNGVFVECNKASEALIGGTREDIIGKVPPQISPEYQPNGKRSDEYVNEVIKEAFDNETHTFEWVHKRVDGTEFLAKIKLSAIEYDGVDSLFVNWSDITEQRKAEEDILKFRTITEKANYGVAIAGLDGTLLYSNDYFAKMHGYEVLEIAGKNLAMLHSSEQLIRVGETIELLKNVGEFHNQEVWRTRKDGSVFPSLMNAVMVFDANNLPLYMAATAIDITESNRIKNALIDSESRFSQVAEHSRTVIWEVNMEGLYTYVSPVSQLVYGYRPEELVGKKFFYDLHPKDVRESFKEAGFSIINGGEQLSNFDNPIESKDGKTIWVSTNGTPLKDDKNRIIGYRGADIDITSRKIAEENVLKGQDKLNYAQEIVKMGSWEHDFITHTHTWSKNYFKIIGLDPDKDRMDKEYLMNLIHPDDLAIFTEKQIELEKSRKPLSFEFRFIMPDSSIKWIHEIVMPIYKNEELIALSGVNIDITEQKLKDKEIIKLSTAVEQSPIEVVITDLDGNIEYVNAAFSQITGYSREEVIGKNPRVLKSGVTKQEVYKNLWDTITEGRVWQSELVNKKKNGELFWEDISITPILGDSGKIESYLAIKQDITQRKRTEQEILELNSSLEARIEERTSQLTETNEELNQEIEERMAIEESLIAKSNELETFFSVALDLLCIANTSGQFLKVNKAWEDILGYSSVELEHRQFLEFVHPDDLQATLDVMTQLDEQNPVLKFVNRYRTKDQTYRFIEWHSVPVGNLIYAAARDITDRKRQENFELEVLELSTKLTGLPVQEIPESINLALERIGKFMNADRSFILEINSDEILTNMTYEWFAEGVPSHKNNCQNIPISEFPLWWETLKKNQTLIIEDIDEMPIEWGEERDKLRNFGNKAMVVIPLFAENKLIGCSGLGSLYERKVTSKEEINILRIWSRMLTSLINNLRSEELIEQTRKNYESFFNTLDDFLWVLDKEGKIVHFNNTAVRRLEYSLDELVGSSIIMVHPSDRQNEAKEQLQTLLSGSDDTFSIPLMTKSGHIIPVETKAIHGFWNGQPIIFKISKDITSIKLSEEKFAAAFKTGSAMMAISLFDEGNYIDVNAAFLDTIGYTRSEVLGKTNKELGLFVDPNLRNEIVNNLNNDIPIRKLETLVKVKDGSIKTILVSADSIIVGNKRCMLTVSIDITDRKKAEEELKIARQDAEKANVAKSEFLSRMSHELRTPMNSILGFAQLLEMGELNPGQKKGLNHIMKSGKHLLDLINEVLDISRIEAGRLSLSPEPVLVASIVMETLDIVRPMAADRNIMLVFEDSPDTELFVKSDKQRLKQVLLNIINNAVKYNREGGSIKIKAEKREMNELGYIPVRISVVDTGIGIAKESIENLFKPFERVGAEKTATEGTGLGLAVVKKLVEAMGGLLGVESILGEGSTFWVELPLTESQKEMAEKSGELTEVDKKLEEKLGTILYIEDNIPNIELVEQILSSQKTKISLVTNMHGKEAVSLANKHKPDLILLDLNLPDIHGSDVLKLLQADTYAMNIPVVVISADAMPQQLENLKNLGAKDYLIKPLDVREFLEVINRFIRE